MLQIGVPTEVKPSEKRVALTPQDCKTLIDRGVTICIQSGAGEGAGFADSLYEEVGCVLSKDAAALYESARIIVKVKEPLAQDLQYIKPHHTVFGYLHLASDTTLVEALKASGATAYAFETVVVDGKTPLLAPMSAIAGRLATQIGTWYLHAPRGGNGTLLGGISGISKGVVTVVGAGVAGTESAILAHGMGAHVRILDVNEARLTTLKQEMPWAEVIKSTPESIGLALVDTDLLVGSVYVVGKKAPTVVTAEHIKNMPKGSVVVDISIDQGGCIETSKPCTHTEPTYMVGDVIHSAITNLPAAAPRTASEILSSAITPYVEQLATGFISQPLKDAINIRDGALLISL